MEDGPLGRGGAVLHSDVDKVRKKRVTFCFRMGSKRRREHREMIEVKVYCKSSEAVSWQVSGDESRGVRLEGL